MEIRSQESHATTNWDRNINLRYNHSQRRSINSFNQKNVLCGIEFGGDGWLFSLYTKYVFIILLCIGWKLEPIKCDQGMFISFN